MSDPINRGQPPYLQIVEELRRRIVSGELAPGDHLPSGREIAQQWGCAYATAAKVLTTLRKEGLAESYPGHATVVSSRQRHRNLGDRYQAARHSAANPCPYERSEIRESRIIEAPDAVAIALGLQPRAVGWHDVDLGRHGLLVGIPNGVLDFEDGGRLLELELVTFGVGGVAGSETILRGGHSAAREPFDVRAGAFGDAAGLNECGWSGYSVRVEVAA